MKVCVIQPEYSTDYTRSEELFQKQLQQLQACDETMDLIVLPEMADIPALAKTRELAEASAEKYNETLLARCAETAKRCSAMVFVNARSHWEGGLRNTTYCFDREGNVAGQYHKQHLTPGEVSVQQLDSAYSFEPSAPTVVEMEGLRFCFLTCYDFYFYEAFSRIALEKPDFIIGCSHQRSDTHEALALSSRFLAYNTNAYVVRASVSMGETSPFGGCSMVVAPDGTVLCDLKSRVGTAVVEIDPKAKYYKPAGFGNPLAAHWEYIEQGRRPWKYRPAGPSIVLPDDKMPYPRVCAHRGFNAVAPENSMPAFGAAIAMGAEEIEFDLWETADGEIVSIHDASLERVSNGTGKVYDHTYAQLLELDFGTKRGQAYAGLKIPTFEQILQKFACQTIMNIHIKTRNNDTPLPEAYLKKIIAMVEKYDCTKHVYFMSGNDFVLAQLQQLAPHIARCCGGGKRPWDMVERAMEYGCTKIQLFKPKFNQAMIDKAHANGIRCNVFWSDNPEEAKLFRHMGIDTILTNDYHRVAQSLR